uniref:Uncharacterized protein n=1 Tax=Leersia perrieri TaxID=77586 RepID=A0A0D9VUE3_9ORYZ
MDSSFSAYPSRTASGFPPPPRVLHSAPPPTKFPTSSARPHRIVHLPFCIAVCAAPIVHLHEGAGKRKAESRRQWRREDGAATLVGRGSDGSRSGWSTGEERRWGTVAAPDTLATHRLHRRRRRHAQHESFDKFLFLNNINLGALNRLPSPRPIHLSGRTYSDGAAKTFTGNIDVHQNSASTTVNKVNHFCCFFVF